MILHEERVKEALRICATNDEDKCDKCPYLGWCKANPINPFMNMPIDALSVIETKDHLMIAYDKTYDWFEKQLAKAKLNLKRYGRRIREQREEILELRAKLDGTAVGTPPDTCASCGDVIPEGRQVCPTCESQ